MTQPSLCSIGPYRFDAANPVQPYVGCWLRTAAGTYYRVVGLTVLANGICRKNAHGQEVAPKQPKERRYMLRCERHGKLEKMPLNEIIFPLVWDKRERKRR